MISLSTMTASLASESATAAFLVQECTQLVDKSETVLGSWRLIFINARGSQQDRIILLTNMAVWRFNIDFKTAAIKRVTRLSVDDMEEVAVGPLAIQGPKAKKVGTLMGGTSRAMHGGPESCVPPARAVRITMSDAFVSRSERGGVSAVLSGRGDEAGVKSCTLISKLAADVLWDTPDPQSGPRSIHSFEHLLRHVLSERGRSIVTSADVLLDLGPVGVVRVRRSLGLDPTLFPAASVPDYLARVGRLALVCRPPSSTM